MERIVTTLHQRHSKASSGLTLELNDEHDDDSTGPSPMSPFQVITDPQTQFNPNKKAFYMYQNPSYDPSLQAAEKQQSSHNDDPTGHTSLTRSGYPLKHKDLSVSSDQMRKMRGRYPSSSSSGGSSRPSRGYPRTRTNMEATNPKAVRAMERTSLRASRAEQPTHFLSRTPATLEQNPLYFSEAYENPCYEPTDNPMCVNPAVCESGSLQSLENPSNDAMHNQAYGLAMDNPPYESHDQQRAEQVTRKHRRQVTRKHRRSPLKSEASS